MHTDDTLTTAFLDTRSGRTRQNSHYTLRLWRTWLTNNGLTMIGANRHDIETWIAQRRESGVSARTICTDLGHLHALYRWALEENHITTDPTVLIRRPTPGRTTRPWLGPHDTRKLLTESLTWKGGELAAHTHLWALSGLRPGEPRGLTVTHLHPHDERTTLTIPATKTCGRERITLPETTARILMSARGERSHGPLLVHPRTGRAWTKAAERRRFITFLRDVGLPYITPYSLRVGFITHALSAGIDERLVMISARHSSTSQTARYDRERDQVERAVGPQLAQWLDGLAVG